MLRLLYPGSYKIYLEQFEIFLRNMQVYYKVEPQHISGDFSASEKLVNTDIKNINSVQINE